MNTLLIPIAFLTSTFTAIVGMGGGILLIAAMPGFVSSAAIVPLHGVVQLASNSSRVLFGNKHVVWSLTGFFAGGALLGACLGASFIRYIDWDYLPLFLGILLLLCVWLPRFENVPQLPGKFFFLGFFQTGLSLFFGIAGPLSMSFLLREKLSRDQLVITSAAQMTLLHLLKVAVFGFLGFAFASYAYLLLGMILASTLGSYVGTKIRPYVSENWFRKIFKVVVTLLALRMILRVFS